MGLEVGSRSLEDMKLDLIKRSKNAYSRTSNSESSFTFTTENVRLENFISRLTVVHKPLGYRFKRLLTDTGIIRHLQ